MNDWPRGVLYSYNIIVKNMKNIAILLCAALVGGAAVTSCNSRAQLSESLQGEWTGNPEKVLDSGAASASMVRMLEFVQGNADTEGTITMTANITVDNTMPFNDSIQTPLTISASGVATITGTYQAKDDDEVVLMLDNTSFSVSVDPEGVQLNYNVLADSSASSVEKLKPAAVILATQQINRAAQNAFTNLHEIDDIHVKGTMMKCEINHQDLVFHRAAGK